MFSLDVNIKRYSYKYKVAHRFMGISFIAIFITVVISSVNNPISNFLILLWLLNLIQFFVIIFSRHHFDVAINIFFILLVLIVLLFDISGLLIISICSFLYMLPMMFSLLLLNFPRNYIYSLSTLAIFSIRTVLTSEVAMSEKIILILFAYVGTALIFFVKDWVLQLHEYKMASLQKIHNTSIKILGKVAELKDEGTANHLDRVEVMVELLCNSLKKDKKYSNYINDRYIHDIRSAAYLHDIGKIGIPDKILGKRGPLSDKEFEIMKSHTTIGFELLSDASSEIEGESVYDLAMEIARHHHEKWDGNGYPYQLSGEEIPFSARVMAIIDVYDALVSRRPYKVPFPHSKAIEIIKEESGTHFDPLITEHFITISEKIHMKISPLLI